ncbi:MmgE/PrpD family protein [Salinigranum rubrum]|uniref:MmgE/PrpD family protein n=1 Tax=Salinigranum rubrum TaxID=755307 RepID=A0A2I8VFT7_9EURY|nr:MmgE/PrpD family protein [Salinigranum rubrum]AUV80797.1 MmgE/PrpD family protein [Salinigranum rubrum]
MTTAAEMADFVVATTFDDLSEEVVDETKKRLLDSIAIATGSIGAEPVEILRETVAELDNDGTTSIWGSEMKTSPPLATALNGGMVRYLDFMDAYLLSGEVPHPSNNVAPAVAAAEYTDASGKELIRAIGLAYEIHYQLGKNAPLMDRGWDHGTYVTFASAAGAGSLFGLDRDALMNAIGIAGVGHNALRVTRTGDLTMWKGLSASNAGRNAVYAVMLANNGMEGPIDVFEGQKGWKQIISGPFEVEYTPCEAVTETMTKKYMAGTVAQTQLDGLEELLARESIDPHEIERIEVDTYKRAKIIMGGTGKENESGNRHNVQNREQADHSLPYTMAALALDGELGHDQYELDRLHRDDVQDLLRRIHIFEDPDLTERYENGEMPAVIRITLTDGSVYEIEKSYFEGHPATPMSWEQLGEKFAMLADGVYTPDEQEAIVDAVRNLDEMETRDLVALLTQS